MSFNTSSCVFSVYNYCKSEYSSKVFHLCCSDFTSYMDPKILLTMVFICTGRLLNKFPMLLSSLQGIQPSHSVELTWVELTYVEETLQYRRKSHSHPYISFGKSIPPHMPLAHSALKFFLLHRSSQSASSY